MAEADDEVNSESNSDMEEANQDAFDRARLQVIKDGYEKAFECINRGLTEDEAGHKAQALAQYTKGRQHLLRAISVPSQGHECVGCSWESARQMQHKMQETLNNITTRLAVLETSPDPELPPPLDASNGVPGTASNSYLYPKLEKEKPEQPSPPKLLMTNCQPVVPVDLPPAYSSQAADGHLTISYGTESGEMSLVGEEFYSHMSPAPQSLGEDGEELFFLSHGVQIFFVTPDGQVSAPSYPGYLRMVKFTSQQSERVPNRPPAFLQVCDWLYPLMATDSPVLLCNTGVFMFPDMMESAAGSYVGVVLSSELPVEDRQLFQDMLSQMTDLRVQAPNEAADSINLSQKVSLAPLEEEEDPAAGEEEKNLPEWSEKVASGILTGASWLSWGLVKGAEFTGTAIHKGASKLREHITPEDKPAHVSPSVSKGLHVAKQATGGAVRVSQFLVDGVCMVAGCVGKELAPHVKKHGSKLVPESMKKDKDGRSNIDGAMVVAASGVQGFATMWTGLEVAAKNITVSVASETVNTVKHKYGVAAGQATDHAVNSAINMGVTAFNIDNLGIKAAVKKTGKQTAVAILQDYQLQDPNTNQKQVEKQDK
ncbi:spartin-like isoform X6 [Oncorhynchus clarkii lewisi]|uniref:spartin-like isoform X6 n=1 Tax=Oncorhynchus clarkii lewisi TaxID=490388 RepID=UPI0039B99FD7